MNRPRPAKLPDQFLPLSPAALHILLALAANDLHGYGIMQEVARQSEGQYKLGPGTLYDNLKKLMLQGLIEETGSRSPNEDPRRRYYRLTGSGREVLTAEVRRLEGVLREARTHLNALDPRRT
jgi:DNA-binding PadR family transcriptional regulator